MQATARIRHTLARLRWGRANTGEPHTLVRVAAQQRWSPADVGLHALVDAVLGALGAGDIGDHFPPHDPQWRGAPSVRFAGHARDLVAAAGGVIGNLDVTLACEQPRIGRHRAAMVASIAEAFSVEAGRVSVKATTTERLGFLGRGEGIACLAVATLRLPAS